MYLLENFDKMLDKVREQYHYMEEAVSNANRRVAEYDKDAEVQKARAEAQETRRRALCVLSEKEAEDIEAFRRFHYEKHVPHTRISGNTYVYTLTGTGIGTVIKIKCPICGEEKDVTDIESW